MGSQCHRSPAPPVTLFEMVLKKFRETLEIYWILVRIVVPVTIATEQLSRMGIIEALAPGFAPLMSLVGLPPELGLAWLSGMLIGIWGAVPLIFALVPVDGLSIADMTVFSALLLFAHGLPVEQKIIQKAGPGMIATTLLRVAGGLLYAFVLHHLFAATGWLSSPVAPSWIPTSATPQWSVFFIELAQMMVAMFVILLVLVWVIEILAATGILKLLMRALAPVLRLAGIGRQASHLTAVGLLLGISYGGGLLIKQARCDTLAPRQIFVSCVFMGFAHSIIEDTLIVVALGADLWSVLVGRVVFAILATAAVAGLVRLASDQLFFGCVFHAAPCEEGR